MKHRTRQVMVADPRRRSLWSGSCRRLGQVLILAVLLWMAAPGLAQGAAPYEPNDTRGEATGFIVDDLDQTHSFTSDDDVDWIRFWAEENHPYAVILPTGTVGPNADPVVALYDEAGILASGFPVDDGAAGEWEFINWTAPAAGFYYLLITHDNSLVQAGVDSGYGLTIYWVNPGGPQTGLLKGVVTSSCDRSAIAWAQINAQPPANSLSQQDGTYGLPLDPGSYTVTAAASGYQPRSGGATITENVSTVLDFSLVPSSGCVLPPIAPSGLSASDGAYLDHVALAWGDVAGTDLYQPFRCTSSSTGSCLALGATASASLNDYGAASATTYYYRVKACDGGLCSDFSAEESGYVANWLSPPPMPPVSVSATDGLYSDRIEIGWGGVSGATLYQLYRCTSTQVGSCGLIGETSGLQRNDTGVVVGTTYYYRVKACVATSCSDFSNADGGHLAGVLYPPAAPASIAASDGSYSDYVGITWGASANAVSYDLFRCANTTLVYCTAVGSTPTTSLNDSGVSVDVTYYYRVRACNSAGCSGLSGYDGGYASVCAQPMLQIANTILSGVRDYCASEEILLGPALTVTGTAQVDLQAPRIRLQPGVRTYLGAWVHLHP